VTRGFSVFINILIGEKMKKQLEQLISSDILFHYCRHEETSPERVSFNILMSTSKNQRRYKKKRPATFNPREATSG
jgi:hypothetical protein